MDNPKYVLRYLPLFYEDLEEAIDYISNDLQNPDAAMLLVEMTEKAIVSRLENPTAFAPVSANENRKHKYYRINVNNYAIFYVVIDNVMELRRFIYSKRDLRKLI